MKKIYSTALIAMAVVGAHASVTPFTIDVNYGRTNSFTDSSGNSTFLAGPQIGLSQSLVNLPLLGQVRFGASVLFGGGFGGGTKGNVYGLHALYKSPTAGPSGPYILGGFNYSIANGNNGSFDNVSGFGLEFGVGIPFKTGVPGAPTPAIEAKFQQGPHPQLRMFSVGVSIQF